MDNRATAWVGKLLADQQKKIAAEHALNFIQPGTTIGIGTGSTADHFTRALGRKVAEGMEIVGVPTSVKTAELARACGIPLTTLDQVPRLSVTVDGADEVGPGLDLIKGAGGALLREKIVANASDRMIVIADASKDVAELGAFPLPIEVSLFGLQATLAAIESAIGDIGMPTALPTASMTLANSARILSPGESTTRPLCFWTTWVITSRYTLMVRTVA